MLWLALHFFRLPVEVLALPAPAAAVAQQRIVAADAMAEAAGIRPHMRLADALALQPALAPHERQPEREATALNALACWAGGFTPQVSLAPPDGLLLEIGGCLRLFGGREKLLGQVRAQAEAQGWSLRCGLAPTAQAAAWLTWRDFTGEHWEATLAALPVGVLALPDAAFARLHALGLHRLGQLFELPAAGLGHRFGAELIRRIACAHGRQPDPRVPFVFPQRFDERLELPAKVEQADRLLFAARRLLLALAGWLQARSAGIGECTLELVHEDAPPTALALRFATATRDGERLLRVAREQLERHRLREPAIELRLHAEAAEPLPGRSGGLFGEAGAGSIAPVVDRLRARLGEAAVHGVAAAEDHRPECATRTVPWPAPPAAGAAGMPPRPLWLKSPPVRLAEIHGRPTHRGAPLLRLTRAERIESGWWDAGEATGDARRDYFVACSAQGAWLWIFRDVRGWWWHGEFG